MSSKRPWLAAILLACALATEAGAQIYTLTEQVGEYTLSGVPVSTNLTSGTPSGPGVAWGTNLFIADYNSGTIGEYSLSGVPLNTNLVSGLVELTGLVVSGGNMYVSTLLPGNGAIAEYTLSGVPVKTNLIPGLRNPIIRGIAGGDLYVGNYPNPDIAWIAVYTLSGTPITTNLVPREESTMGTFAVSDQYLFVAEQRGGPGAAIHEYTLDGVLVTNNLIPGLVNGYVESVPQMAVSGNNLFVLSRWDSEAGGVFSTFSTIGRYTLSGVPINTNLITFPTQYAGFFLGPSPEITSFQLVDTGAVSISFDTDANRSYVLQCADCLISNGAAAWSNLFTLAAQPANGQAVYVDSATNLQRFYRLSASP
jgi:hypothetical protein